MLSIPGQQPTGTQAILTAADVSASLAPSSYPTALNHGDAASRDAADMNAAHRQFGIAKAAEALEAMAFHCGAVRVESLLATGILPKPALDRGHAYGVTHDDFLAVVERFRATAEAAS